MNEKVKKNVQLVMERLEMLDSTDMNDQPEEVNLFKLECIYK